MTSELRDDPRRPAGPRPSTSRSGSSHAGAPVLDADALAQLESVASAAHLDGVFEDVVELFLEESEESVTSLVIAHDNGDADGLITAARALRHAATRVGARTLATTCGRFEASLPHHANSIAPTPTRADEKTPPAAHHRDDDDPGEVDPTPIAVATLRITGMTHEVRAALIDVLRRRRA